jgi:glutamate carboxypeptidase
LAFICIDYFPRHPLALALAFGTAHAAPQSDAAGAGQERAAALSGYAARSGAYRVRQQGCGGREEDCRIHCRQAARQGGKVEVIEPSDIYRLDDTPEQVGPMVHAEFKGKGSSRIMLIAHMDTVYLPGMLKDQPFASTATRPMAWASPTTSRAWP